MSFPPPSRTMKPKPLVALCHSPFPSPGRLLPRAVRVVAPRSSFTTGRDGGTAAALFRGRALASISTACTNQTMLGGYIPVNAAAASRARAGENTPSARTEADRIVARRTR